MTATAENVDVMSLSPVSRWHLGLAALGRAHEDPQNTAEILRFATYVNAGTSDRRVDRFFADADGQRLYAERRAIDSRLDLDALAALPVGTLGRAYVDFLREGGLSPDIFQAPANVVDPRAAYVAQRVRQSHDLWHVLTGTPTDIPGELVLQAFTFAQLGAPSALLLVVGGLLRGFWQVPELPMRAFRAWRRGRKTAYLANFPWEDHWTDSLDELRLSLGV